MTFKVLALGFYWLENRRLYFNNPAFFVFWFLESGAYLILSYQHGVQLSHQVLYSSKLNAIPLPLPLINLSNQ